MGELIWVGPDGQVYTVSVLEEPWDKDRPTMTIVFRSLSTGWVGATELDTGADASSIAADDFPVLLRRAKA